MKGSSTTIEFKTKSVGKAFAVLHAFAADKAELTITEVASSAGLDHGTAFRLIIETAVPPLLQAVRTLTSAVRKTAANP